MLDELEEHWPPHGQAIGLKLVNVEGRRLFVKVPYAEKLVGDPDTGVIHGGVITAALDNACGWAIRVGQDEEEFGAMATLDIRIDYMKPSTPHEDLLIVAECYKKTRNVAFVRAIAYNTTEDDPVAAAVAAFMMGTRSEPHQTV